MEIYIIRHGQSEANVLELCYGLEDYPLTEKGREDAAICAEKLKEISFDVCYTSQLCRAQETAAIATVGRDIPVISTPLLNEQNMGDFEGISFSDLIIKYPKSGYALLKDWTNNAPPGGETYDQVYARVSQFADQILADGRDCLIAAHFGSLSALTARLLDLDKHAAARFHYAHGGITHIRVTSRGPSLERFNG